MNKLKRIMNKLKRSYSSQIKKYTGVLKMANTYICIRCTRRQRCKHSYKLRRCANCNSLDFRFEYNSVNKRCVLFELWLNGDNDLFWFKVLGFGILHIRNIKAHNLIFSESNGNTNYIKIGRWVLKSDH